jgi:glycerophosphoryl diester phosphodiesterase
MAVDHPYLDWPGPVAFAHRGGTSEHPENTLPAFAHAVGLGYRYLETDVHVSVDGVLVAFHDPDLRRTCGVDGEIASMPWARIAAARVDGRAPIPTMRELLEAFPDARFNIDCKSDRAVDALVHLVEDHDAIDRVCIGAFGHRRLGRIRARLGPGLLTALSPQEVAALRIGRRLPGAGPRVAQVPVRAGRVEVVTERFVADAHRLGVAVHVWTIDDPAEMHRLLDRGVDGIMTDRPEVLRSVLESRGAWVGSAPG